jgi:hypothetical protein
MPCMRSVITLCQIRQTVESWMALRGDRRRPPVSECTDRDFEALRQSAARVSPDYCCRSVLFQLSRMLYPSDHILKVDASVTNSRAKFANLSFVPAKQYKARSHPTFGYSNDANTSKPGYKPVPLQCLRPVLQHAARTEHARNRVPHGKGRDQHWTTRIRAGGCDAA